MRNKSISFAIAAFSSFVHGETCLNDETYRQVIDGEERSCTYIRFREELRQEQCLDPDVFAACPHTCGVCCEDDPNYTFTNGLDKEVDCAWLLKNDSKAEVRTSKFCTAEDGQNFQNGKNIRSACSKSCDFCFSLITPNTEHPTSSSVPSPLLSSVPSGKPSSSPSDSPTPFACINDRDYRININGEVRSCNWIRYQEDRRKELCLDEEVRQFCPHSCGLCCEDDPNYTFTNGLDLEVDCSWILKNENKVDQRKAKFCIAEDGDQFDVINIRVGCPRSCDFCFSEIEAASQVPSSEPSNAPSEKPSTSASQEPSQEPTRSPTQVPTRTPSISPSQRPTSHPSKTPSRAPSVSPTFRPSAHPSASPTHKPSEGPSVSPSSLPSVSPSHRPTTHPSKTPSSLPSVSPTFRPSTYPSLLPTRKPSEGPSTYPTHSPTLAPTVSLFPSFSPTETCRDQSDFLFLLELQEDIVDCDWITFSNVSERREMYCAVAEIKAACKYSCQFCVCEDNYSYQFELENLEGEFRGCEWLTKNDSKAPARLNRYCFEEDGVTSSVVAGQCTKSCGFCVEDDAPSSTPTLLPSRITLSPTSSPTLSMGPTAAPTDECVDDSDFTFILPFELGTVDCNWLTISNKEVRFEKFCTKAEIKAACRRSCDFCVCEDDPSYTFELENFEGEFRTCDWLTKNSEKAGARLDRYCFESDGETGSEVASKCTKSCGFCYKIEASRTIFG